MIAAPVVRGLGLLSGWGRGAAAIPGDAVVAAAGRRTVGLGRVSGPRYTGDRYRRTTRECLWALASVEAMLEDVGAARETLAGDGTALVFVSAAVYAASNRAFIEGGGGSTHFAYTAPAVVPAEVAIEFGLTGPSAIFIGGPPATLRAIWHAATLLAERACDRVLVLAVETFAECEDLYETIRRRTPAPFVEASGCLWLEPGPGRLSLAPVSVPRRAMGATVRRRIGETFACEPLAAVALWRAAGCPGPLCLEGGWRGEAVRLAWEDA
ncbi:MAG: beta-ketoacyl synthase N-terminal-like domain-containing protein [Candidatus Rokuibacteriota bacterium]